MLLKLAWGHFHWRSWDVFPCALGGMFLWVSM